MTRQKIIAEVLRTAEENGGTPLGKAKFRAATGITDGDWGRFWARWGEVVAEAGFEPNSLRAAYDDEYVFEKLIELVRELGRYPVINEIKLKARNDKSFPSHNVFQSRGKKRELAAKLLSYCQTRAGYDDIVEVCLLVSDTDDEVEEESAAFEEDGGFVYLMKSGRFYKVGRTNSVGRREYELSIQLPEKLEQIHVISTDDPEGIESYWHSRFKEKRANGEWFRLSADDVRAFKRRKFM